MKVGSHVMYNFQEFIVTEIDGNDVWVNDKDGSEFCLDRSLLDVL